jgi:hypothetical protein
LLRNEDMSSHSLSHSLFLDIFNVPGFISPESESKTTLDEIIKETLTFSPRMRFILEAYYGDQKEIKEIALNLSLSTSVVRGDLEKGKHRLRKKFNIIYRDRLEGRKDVQSN